jgi:NDP-sugar pyrophosphorylase family protein
LLHEHKPLFGYRSGAYWMDIGTPGKYLQAHVDLLTGRLATHLPTDGEHLSDQVWAGQGTFVHSSARLSGPVVLGNACHVGENAFILGPTVLGDNCVVGDDAELQGVVAWNGVTFAARSRTRNSIVAHGATVGSETRVEDGSIVGDKANTGANNYLSHGLKLQPGVTLPDTGVTF